LDLILFILPLKYKRETRHFQIRSEEFIAFEDMESQASRQEPL